MKEPVSEPADKPQERVSRKPRKQAGDSRIRDFFAWWGETYKERLGVPYVPTFGADGAQLKRLFAALDGQALPDLPQKVREAAGRFFDNERQAEYGGYTIRAFCTNINRYLADKPALPAKPPRFFYTTDGKQHVLPG